MAKSRGWQITQVLNTHDHFDHTGGNQDVVAATGAKLLAHANASDAIPGMDEGLQAGDIVKIGNSVELEALDTPGHTASHICLLSHTDQPALFSGDTLFNAGAGHCHDPKGNPELLYETFVSQFAKLPNETLIYPGHDYMVNNLQFTLSCEPENIEAKALLENTRDQHPDEALVSTLAMEKDINTFLRLHNPAIISRLQKEFPDLEENPDARAVFLKLRELRNNW